ncbi:hypothetical protein ACF1AO_33595 [Streptomyces longwoodensis]|uniref:hypothetical protein n=1 Tax=Streptomyces longwoodensis TaxID=68231 RepID=UPI0036F629A6
MHSFPAAALGRLLLELLCRGGLPGVADAIVRFTENILTEDLATSPTSCANWRPRG